MDSVAELHAKLVAVFAERDELRAERQAFLRSTSWQLTRPLRWIARLLRGQWLDHSLLAQRRESVSPRALDEFIDELGGIEAIGSTERANPKPGPFEFKSIIRAAIEDWLIAERSKDRGSINQCAAHVYSQNYEDAIIAEIYARIGEQSRVFVEIGVGDGTECNTRALLERGWTGLWIDSDADAVAAARTRLSAFIDRGALQIVKLHLTRDNIQSALADRLDGEIDFLSVDIDYNTSHVWRAIELPARVACIEYNANLGSRADWEVAYHPAGVADTTCTYGASLKCLERIGRKKQMSLVGCDIRGVNAFFVHERFARGDLFTSPFTAEQHFEPARYGLLFRRGHATPH